MTDESIAAATAGWIAWAERRGMQGIADFIRRLASPEVLRASSGSMSEADEFEADESPAEGCILDAVTGYVNALEDDVGEDVVEDAWLTLRKAVRAALSPSGSTGEGSVAAQPLSPSPVQSPRNTPLSDDDIEMIASSVRPIKEGGEYPSWEHAVARAIERAHGIANTQGTEP